jgi:drug/metabolite transporter (DMT)-like permease
LNNESRLRLYLLILCMVTFWAASFAVGKLALREIPPLVLPAIRITMAAVFMLPLYLWWKRRKQAEHGDIGAPDWTRADIPMLSLLALLGVAFNQLLFVVGLNRTSVGHASLIIATSPVMVWIGSMAKGYERFRAARLIGLAMAIAGVVVLQVLPAPQTGATLLGDALVFASIVMFASFSVLSRAVSRRLGPITVNTFYYAVSAAVLIPIGVAQSSAFDIRAVSAVGWTSVVFLAVFPSVLAYLIFAHAVSRIPPSRVSQFSYLQPFLATLLAVPLIQEPLTGSFFAGGALVLGGVFLADRLA